MFALQGSWIPAALVQGALNSSKSGVILRGACWLILNCALRAIHVVLLTQRHVHIELLSHVKFHRRTGPWDNCLVRYIIVTVLSLLLNYRIHLRHKLVFLEIKYLISLLMLFLVAFIHSFVAPTRGLVHLSKLFLCFLLIGHRVLDRISCVHLRHWIPIGHLMLI